MQNALSLLERGLFPETLPPCFTSVGAGAALKDIVQNLENTKFRRRSSDFIRYNGTKHDRNRRFFGTPNLISYYHVSAFIHQHWKEFEDRFGQSSFSLSSPVVMPDSSDRAIKVASLSELSAKCSKNLSYAPVVLKTDISQFYSSIYTHSIAWSRHGKAACKADMNERSKEVYFNALDFFTRNCQSAQTRGVVIGPDAFRLIAEYISCGIDVALKNNSGDAIVGAVRHVDDYYIGLRSETDALVVLSHLRELLSSYELQINDNKTKVFSSLEPINDLWAQRIRRDLDELKYNVTRQDRIELLFDEAFEQSRKIGSDSPIKMVLRGLDSVLVYKYPVWDFVEGYLQRCMHYHPHAIDYISLLVVKRSVLGKSIDYEGWKAVSENLIKHNLPYRNHHEIIWLVWLMLACEISLSSSVVEELGKADNAHLTALIAQAFTEGRIDKKPPARFNNRLSSSDSNWLFHLISRSSGITKASFGGDFAEEFEHICTNEINLIDISGSISPFLSETDTAISRSRYGYDDIEESDLVAGFFDDD